ncbi:MAG: 16S rRNA processing protein RimM [Clostridiales bacterium]|nr:16S rRNA processing protein RimM [Clostridiales bacterium]
MDYIRIGLILKPQGIRGEIKVSCLSDRLDRFLELEYVFLEDKGTYTKYNVKGTRLGDECAFLFLEKIYDRDAAEKLRNKYICVDRKNAIKLPEGRYFIFDLIGCNVITDTGENIGKVTDVMQPGANDVYVVKNDKSEVLIPAVKSFVLDIDINKKQIIVKGDMLQEVAVYED